MTRRLFDEGLGRMVPASFCQRTMRRLRPSARHVACRTMGNRQQQTNERKQGTGDADHQRTTTKARRVLLYGQERRKSTWASMAPRPIFSTSRTVWATRRRSRRDDDTRDARNDYGGSTSEHEYQSVVFDTVDWFERLLRPASVRPTTRTESRTWAGLRQGYTDSSSSCNRFSNRWRPDCSPAS